MLWCSRRCRLSIWVGKGVNQESQRNKKLEEVKQKVAFCNLWLRVAQESNMRVTFLSRFTSVPADLLSKEILLAAVLGVDAAHLVERKDIVSTVSSSCTNWAPIGFDEVPDQGHITATDGCSQCILSSVSR